MKSKSSKKIQKTLILSEYYLGKVRSLCAMSLSIPRPHSLGALYRLLHLLAPKDVYLDFVGKYRRGEKFYGTLKTTLAEHVSKFNAPIIERFNEPGNDEESVKEFLRANAEKVTPVALETVEAVREAIGIGRSLYRA